MRELSLHILDLAENSIRAGASIICVSVREEPARNRLEIVVEDNGPGLPVAPEHALDPFYTTKEGKRTGLGLSLFQAAAEQAGGRFDIAPSDWGGTRVRAVMQLDHVDRAPLGDLSGTLSVLVCTNPGIDFWCRVRVHGREHCVRSGALEKEVMNEGGDAVALARRFGEAIRTATAGGLA